MTSVVGIRCGWRVLIAAAAGGLYACAFPPVDQGGLAGMGFLMLLVALHGQSGTKARALGFLFGLLAFGTSLSWLWNLFGSLAILLWCVLAAFPALFADMQGRAARAGVAGWKFALFTACNWGAWEFIRAELFPLKFPWMTIALAFEPMRALPWIGVYGAGMVVVLSCAAVFVIWGKNQWSVFRRTVVLVCGVLIAGIFLSPTPQYHGPSPDIRAAAIQLENVSINEYLKATRELPGDVRYVVWPEYSVPYDLRKHESDRKLLLDLCREKDITLTFGTRRDDNADGTKWRNVALTMDATGIRGEHTKVHTVHLFDDGTAGKTALPVDTANGKAGTPVCFDGDYEDVFRRMTAAGAEFFMVPSMDAESWSAREHDQHAELYRIRAAENGRFVFIAATSGVSQMIDPAGKVIARLGAMKQGTLLSFVGAAGNTTFYTRTGWLFPWINLSVAIACWIYLLLRKKPRDGSALACAGGAAQSPRGDDNRA
ncbi:MAG: nitrilase-related carbon-nitrogen hydrolase [Verrucomicrobiota bacterium]